MKLDNSLNFPHTCSKIDKAIDNCKTILYNQLYDIIKELSPLIPDNHISRLASDYSDNLYDKISDCFESVRETNEEMREQADYQIKNLVEKIEELEDIVKQSENL